MSTKFGTTEIKIVARNQGSCISKSNMPTTRPKHIVFAGGGTGGHLFPGLATAEVISQIRPEIRITFVGSGRAFEREHVYSFGFDYRELPCYPLPLKKPWHLPKFAKSNLSGYRMAKQFLQEESVSAVVGLGCYVSVPMAWASRSHRIPLVLLEQNMIPGRATRWLARKADHVCIAFEASRKHLPRRAQIEVTGTPLRPGFGLESLETACWSDTSQLLVLGGSGGAQSLNESVPRALCLIHGRLQGWKVLHQSGEAACEATKKLYKKFDLSAEVVPFIANMPGTLARTSLAVCRAGGSTLAELAASATPAILIPYSHATNDHQRKNAELFKQHGGCCLLDEREHGTQLAEILADRLGEFMDDEPRRCRVSHTMRYLARPEAAHHVAKIILGQIR